MSIHVRVTFLRTLGFGIAIFLVAVLTTGCSQEPPQKRETGAVEVIITTPITDKVTDYQDFTGRLSAVKTVEIRARVTGFVDTVPFTEGEHVDKGDVLFEINPVTYQADLNQATANLHLAEADARLQEKLAARAQDLLNRKAIAQEEYESAVAAWEKSKASVKAMDAARARAQVYVDYCHVVAPLSGRVSNRYVDPGNLITADTTILTTIVTEDPVYAYFDVDERTYADLRRAKPGRESWLQKLQFPVVMRLANEEEFTHVGTADFIDNRINAGTGTVRMRAVFDNPKDLLKSGLFARIRLPLDASYDALLVPDEALQSDQGRKFLYIVNDKNEVVYRAVKLGQALKSLRVIKEGLKPGERVIVEGMQRVRPGVKVEVKVQPPPKRPNSPLSKLLNSKHGPKVRARGKKDLEHKGARVPAVAP